MMLPEFWNESASQPRTAFLFNHLWQSTVAVLIVWLIANALRNNHARTRYRLWMIASIKFLVPFSALVSAGEWLRSIVAPTIQSSTLPAVIEQIVQPFPSSQNLVASAPVAVDHLEMLPIALLAVWTCGSLVVAIRWGRMWWEVRRAVRTGLPLGLAADVPVLSTPSTLEPGIFGFFRPVLLLPEGIEYRVSPAQLDAIVAHEMCHVRRRDNLTFAIHMVVETLFWFHPLVWWIRARLVEERELACDEAVLAAGNEAEDYAEGILNVCKFYVESPLRCVSGVSGSDLKKRILRIMSVRMGCELDFGRKLLLGLAGLVAVALPLFLGLARIAPFWHSPARRRRQPAFRSLRWQR